MNVSNLQVLETLDNTFLNLRTAFYSNRAKMVMNVSNLQVLENSDDTSLNLRTASYSNRAEMVCVRFSFTFIRQSFLHKQRQLLADVSWLTLLNMFSPVANTRVIIILTHARLHPTVTLCQLFHSRLVNILLFFMPVYTLTRRVCT